MASVCSNEFALRAVKSAFVLFGLSYGVGARRVLTLEVCLTRRNELILVTYQRVYDHDTESWTVRPETAQFKSEEKLRIFLAMLGCYLPPIVFATNPERHSRRVKKTLKKQHAEWGHREGRRALAALIHFEAA